MGCGLRFAPAGRFGNVKPSQESPRARNVNTERWLMSENQESITPPEYNVTGQDYSDRRHFRYVGPPIVDVHAHVFQTRPTDPKDGPPATGPGASTTQAEMMLEVATEFNIGRIYSMCPAEDIPVLRDRFLVF